MRSLNGVWTATGGTERYSDGPRYGRYHGLKSYGQEIRTRLDYKGSVVSCTQWTADHTT
jgi:hypothetical protein